MGWLINQLGGKLMAYGLIAAVTALLAGSWAYKYYQKGVIKERGAWTTVRDRKQDALDSSVKNVEGVNSEVDLILKQKIRNNRDKFGGE